MANLNQRISACVFFAFFFLLGAAGAENNSHKERKQGTPPCVRGVGDRWSVLELAIVAKPPKKKRSEGYH